MNKTQPTAKSLRDKYIVSFGAIQEPHRPKWPKHGSVVVAEKQTGRRVAQSRPVFSIEALRDGLKDLIQRNGELLTTDDAMTIEGQAREAGLPNDHTRFDLLYNTYDRDTTAQIIDRLTRSVPIPQGSEKPRFETCRDGHICYFENCSRYGRHGRFLLEGFDTSSIGVTVFSTAAAEQVLEVALKGGVFVDEDVANLKNTMTLAGLVESNDRTRADRIMANLQPWSGLLLDETFGISKPDPENGKLRFCSGHSHDSSHRHVHLNGRYPHLSHPGGMYTGFQVNQAVNELLTLGTIDETTAALLREEITRYELPAGNSEDPLNTTAKRENDMLLELINDISPLVALETLLNTEDPRIMRFLGGNGRSLRIAFGFGGFGW